MNELGALLRDVRRQSGDPVEVVLLAVAVRYCIVPMKAGMTPRFNLPDELLRDHPLPQQKP